MNWTFQQKTTFKPKLYFLKTLKNKLLTNEAINFQNLGIASAFTQNLLVFDKKNVYTAFAPFNNCFMYQTLNLSSSR